MSRVGWRRRVAALLALPLAGAAVGIVMSVLVRNRGALVLGLLGLAVVGAAAWWLVTEVGLVRILAAVIGVAGAAMLVVALSATASHAFDAAWRIVVVLVVLVAMILLAQYSLRRPVAGQRSPGGGIRVADRPTRPVLLCNPWSGGGKVGHFGLPELAADLGVETVLLDHGLDLEALTRQAVARGADCLGMAGGDGSQALVASVAVEHQLPFVCVPAGTRNHFALDLGLDRDDPRRAMRAFHDAVERHVDFATVNDRLFVNNVSLGIYATIVQSEHYREDKVDVSRTMTTELLGRRAEPFDLQYTTPDGREIGGAFVVMVSNNPYVLGAKRDVAQRRQLDSGRLGVFAISTRTGGQAARLMTLGALGVRGVSRYWWEFTTADFEVRSHSGSAFMGVDGEALESPTPMRFRIHPRGLRMLVPEGNLGAAERRRARDLHLSEVAAVAMGHEPALGRVDPTGEASHDQCHPLAEDPPHRDVARIVDPGVDT